MMPTGTDERPVEVFSYSLPLRQPIRIGAASVSRVSGFLLRVRDEVGMRWGEVAPLNGYSRETTADVAAVLRVPGRTVASLSKQCASLPSLRHGLWMLTDTARIPGPPAAVRLARLVTHGPRDEMLARIAAAADAGFEAVKIKVGVATLDEDIALVKSAGHLVAGRARIRLDANRRWSLEQAIRFARAVEDQPVEFLEEPLASVVDYAALDASVALPLALDESLDETWPWRARRWRNLAALVIKPMRLGGQQDIEPLADWADQEGKAVVISSMYESGVGIRRLLELAARYGRHAAAGLDTYDMLADDVAEPRLTVSDGAFRLADAVGAAWNVDETNVEIVS